MSKTLNCIYLFYHQYNIKRLQNKKQISNVTYSMTEKEQEEESCIVLAPQCTTQKNIELIETDCLPRYSYSVINTDF